MMTPQVVAVAVAEAVAEAEEAAVVVPLIGLPPFSLPASLLACNYLLSCALLRGKVIGDACCLDDDLCWRREASNCQIGPPLPSFQYGSPAWRRGFCLWVRRAFTGPLNAPKFGCLMWLSRAECSLSIPSR